MNLRMLPAIAIVMLGSAAAAQDAAKGKSQFNQCRACHTVDQGQNRVGPTLYDVFGRKAGTVEKFAYSEDMKAAGAKGLAWDEKSMDEYITDPGEFLKKYLGKDSVSNKMPNKYPNAELRANIIVYLKDATKPK